MRGRLGAVMNLLVLAQPEVWHIRAKPGAT
jgi:hypothetical protein